MIASNGVINAYGAPEIASAVATLGTIGTTNVTTGSAWLNGMLISTGKSATAVSAWWGTDDGTNNAAVWDNSATLPAPRLPGPFTFAATGLTADSTYYYRFSASNDTGVVWSEESYSFITGNVWLETTSDASEIGLIPGTVTVHRAATAAAESLTVNYAVGGTATAGDDYTPLSGEVVLEAGKTTAVIEVIPLPDHLLEGDETVVLTLQPGPYALGSGTSATVVIADEGQIVNVWRGSVSALASVAANWERGEVPHVGDKVLFDATSANKPLTWNIDVAVGAWEQTPDYNGTVTFATFYPGQGAFTNAVIDGDVDLHGGIWTHAANSGDSEVSRLQVTVNGDFNLGAGASIDLDGKGFGRGKGPGYGISEYQTAGFSASHGGEGAKTLAGIGTYGSITTPENLGSGANGPGGGASEGFYGDDHEPELEATVESGYTFGVWDNPVGNGNTSDNPITLPPLVGHRALRAWFADQSLNPATNTWSITAANDDWFDARNWELLSVPTAGQTVVIPAGVVVALTNATPRLAEFVFDGNKLTMDGWNTKIDADKIHLKSGTITHAPNLAESPNESGQWIPSARVWLTCDTLQIDSAATVNVDYKGFKGGDYGAHQPGYGPGGGIAYIGGSHGGLGGAYSTDGTRTPTYGVAAAPAMPGSGGGGSSAQYQTSGGAGGGVVRIEATGQVVMNGTISANGAADANVSGSSYVGGGGSGGSIWLTCATITTTGGNIHANGGGAASQYNRSGGGGRIAIVTTDIETQRALLPLPLIIVAKRGIGNDLPRLGFPGTVHVSLQQFLPDHITSTYSRLYGAIRAWQSDSLTIDNTWIGALDSGVLINITNGLQVIGSAGRFDTTNAIINVGGDITVKDSGVMHLFAGSTGTQMNVKNITLTNNAALHVYGGVTNGVTTFSSEVKVREAITVNSGCAIYPHSEPVTGGSVIFKVNDLLVAANGQINAIGSGFGKSQGPGHSISYSGSSHGGLGSSYKSDSVGVIYGCSNAPALPGSGSAFAHGGGMIRVDARRQITVNGTLTANGETAGGASGSGSGGAIYLTCRVFDGAAGGALYANGGSGLPTFSYVRTGGGGRIAIWRVRDSAEGAVTAEAKLGSGSQGETTLGTDGTVVWGFLPASGTIIMLR